MESSIIFNLIVPQSENNDKPPVIKITLEQAISLKTQLDEWLTKPLLEVYEKNKPCDTEQG